MCFKQGMLQQASVHHFCTYPARGGAGIAADRLVRGLIGQGIDARLVGLNPEAKADHIRGIRYRRDLLSNIRRRLRNCQLAHLPDGYEGISPSGSVFFSDRSPNGMAMSEFFTTSSLIHLHWVCDLIDYPDTMKRIPEGIPLVWTLHDMGAFTGGCSYSLGCRRFEEGCGDCPQLENPRAKRETGLSHGRRARAINRIKDQLTLVCPSEWMATEARKSSIFTDVRCEVIRNGFDLQVFHPGKRSAGRDLIGCNDEEPVILFVAASFSNPLKGMHTILEALRITGDRPVRVCYLGDKGEGQFPESWQWLGKIHDEDKLAKLYAGSDLLLVPSEADNYPNVICEALACGVPVIASDIGGIPELVRDGVTGYLFEKGNADAFSERVHQLTEDFPSKRDVWSTSCRQFAEGTFEIGEISKRHLGLYKEIGWTDQSQHA